jgi:Spy/CpxP family protein refolding chaperone
MKLRWIGFSFLALSLACVAPHKANAAAAPAGAAIAAQDHGDWDAPPQELREVQRQGFHDGIEGARKDFENHRQPNVDNREEYRHPNVARDQREDYREGYRRGYERAMAHLTGGHY